MGLIPGILLDTSILIASERRGEAIEEILLQVRTTYGEIDVALSTISVVELTHGIYRAKTEADKIRRRIFAEGAFRDLIVHPVTLEIARLAGQIEGEQAAKGNIIAFEEGVCGGSGVGGEADFYMGRAIKANHGHPALHLTHDGV